MSTTVQDLKRIADSVGRLRDHTVEDVMLRTDCRQLRITLDDGQMLLVSVLTDEGGKPRLDVDLIRPEASLPQRQLEVGFAKAKSPPDDE